MFIMPKKKQIKKTSRSSKKKNISLEGINDILPRDSKFWSRIFEAGLKVGHLHDFFFIKTPPFEKVSFFEKANRKDKLFKEKHLTVEYKKEKIAIGVGGITPIIRSYVEHQLGRFVTPLKAFSFDSVFRKVKGKIRERHECVFGILGESNPFYDGELVLAVLDFLGYLKLKNGFDFKINILGCRVCSPGYLKDLRCYYRSHRSHLCRECSQVLKEDNWRDVLDCGNEKCREVKEKAPIILDRLCGNCNTHFQGFLELIEERNIIYKLDPFLFSGENYYSRSFFEITDQSGRVLAQGGRCDYLFESLCSRPLPSLEAKIFLNDVIGALREREELRNKKEIFFIAVGDEPRKAGLKVVDNLRQQNIKVMEFLGKKSLETQLKIARKAGIRFVSILGQKELFEEVIILRDLGSGNQETVRIDTLGQEIKRRIK